MNRALQSCVFLLALLGGEAMAAPRSLGISAPVNGDSVANDMNGAGQVAAVLEDEEGVQRGVFFDHGISTELGTLGGTNSEAKRINDKGEIVGSATRKDGTWRAILYNRVDGMRDLGTLGGTNSHGTAINNDGDAVGFSDLANGDWHAFLFKHGEKLTDLGTLGGPMSYASGINAKGQVVGTAALANGYRHAFLYDPARGMVDLGTLGGRSSMATAINDAGMIVGASEMPNRRWHAFLFDGKRMVDLGAVIGRGDSYATSINNVGHVVGTVEFASSRMSFIWRDNGMTLHSPGKGLYVVNNINNTEEVVGAMFHRTGLDAATMPSNSAPFVDRGQANFFSLVVLVLLLTGAAIVYRKRYKGILMGPFGDRGGWMR